MKTIWKYELEITDAQTLEIPTGFQILSSQFQNGILCLWAIVDPSEPKEGVTIEVIGTGNPMPDVAGNRKYIGTAQMCGGRLVWHVFVLACHQKT